MLINTVRFYERIQWGMRSQDEAVRDCADSCLSYLVRFLREPQILLPDDVAARAKRLPISSAH